MDDLFVQYAILVVMLAACGLVSGLLSGLFGIGGGAIIVPLLIVVFEELGFVTRASHVAIATSLAVIIPTSVRSAMAHHRHGSVDWDIIRAWAAPIVLGAFVGQGLAGNLSGLTLKGIFAGLAFMLAIQIFFGPVDWRLRSSMPTGFLRIGLGGSTGLLSALMGIGGGIFMTSLMTMCGRPMHKAIGTAAGFGILVGLSGAVVAVFSGWGRSDLPPLSLGYVNLVACVLVSVFTVMTAPVGVRLAHRLNAGWLRRLFAMLLAIVAGKMFHDIIAG